MHVRFFSGAGLCGLLLMLLLASPSAKTMDGVGPIEHASERQQAVEEYKKQFLWIGTESVKSRVGTSTYDVVYQGMHKQALTRARMYELFDDEDLNRKAADAQLHNHLLWGGMTAGSALAAVAGVVMMMRGFEEYELASMQLGTTAFEAAHVRKDVARWTGFGGMLLAGVAAGTGFISSLVWIGQNLDEPSILTGDELRARIEQYNRGLQKKLGLEGVEGLPTGL